MRNRIQSGPWPVQWVAGIWKQNNCPPFVIKFQSIPRSFRIVSYLCNPIGISLPTWKSAFITITLQLSLINSLQTESLLANCALCLRFMIFPVLPFPLKPLRENLIKTCNSLIIESIILAFLRWKNRLTFLLNGIHCEQHILAAFLLMCFVVIKTNLAMGPELSSGYGLNTPEKVIKKVTVGVLRPRSEWRNYLIKAQIRRRLGSSNMYEHTTMCTLNAITSLLV